MKASPQNGSNRSFGSVMGRNCRCRAVDKLKTWLNMYAIDKWFEGMLLNSATPQPHNPTNMEPPKKSPTKTTVLVMRECIRL